MEKKERKPFEVGDKFRKNPMSLEKGGFEVTIWAKGKPLPLKYTNVKNPQAYLKAVADKQGPDFIERYHISEM